jgi:hypothetical protein
VDGDVVTADAKRTDPAPARPAAEAPRAPKRIATLYRRVLAGRGAGRAPALDLPDLAGCYDYDL